jgi:hypothetical protein
MSDVNHFGTIPSSIKREVEIECLNIVLCDATVITLTRMPNYYQLAVSRPGEDGVFLRSVPCSKRFLEEILGPLQLERRAREVLLSILTCRAFLYPES